MPDVNSAQPDDGSLSPDQAHEEAAYTLGVQAWLWGYPLPFYAAMNAESLKIGAAGLNSFIKYPALKTAKDRFVVTPNNVTIDAYAMFDVTHEPAVIHVPALSAARWYIVQVGDQFDQIIFNAGGIKGPMPGAYIITGPDFRGEVPGEMIRIRSSTKWGVVAVRIFAAGEADVAEAADAQKGFNLMPLSGYLREGVTHQPVKGSIPEFKAKGPTELGGFERLGHAMHLYLPVSADTEDSFVAALGQIGLNVAGGFAWQTLDEPTKRGLARALPVAEAILDRKWESLGETTNGWRYNLAGGRSNHDLALRAALCKYMVGGQLAEQVLYPNCCEDADGKPFDGTNKYILRFEPGQLPPVATFWNMAMYADDMLFVENDFGRYSIGSTTDGVKTDADGSLTISIQNQRPEDTSNWLPAPAASFNLTMRFYGPATSVLDGSYRLPAVDRSN